MLLAFFKIVILSVAMQNVVLLSVVVLTKPRSKGNIYSTKHFIYFNQNKKIIVIDYNNV